MPNNMVLLETIALTQSAASVTFDNLPTSGYTDLKVVMSSRADSTQNLVDIKFNSSSVGYTRRSVYGNGSSVSSASGSDSQNLIQSISTNTANTFGNTEIYIPNYRSSNNKSVSMDTVQENNATAATALLGAVLWSNTAAITSISLTPVSGNFVANSTFSLYGIAALGTTPVLAPKATGGNIVANDGTYWYHAFTSSGNFVPQVGLTADVLVVAGGGSGGYTFNGGAGGGGAGGIFYATSQSLTNGTNYACTVGAGGSGTITSSSNGNDSQFGALTLAKGGGAGGKQYGGSGDGAAGGSGGGGGGSGSAYAGGASTQTSTGGTGYGFAGGAGQPSVQNGGGGGGAGQLGWGSTGSSPGYGGDGLNTWSSWATATTTGASGYYAGGGGGNSQSYGNAPGGAGGGGAGGSNGIANTGGGAGGGPNNTTVAAGGSGIILIRYPIA